MGPRARGHGRDRADSAADPAPPPRAWALALALLAAAGAFIALRAAVQQRDVSVATTSPGIEEERAPDAHATAAADPAPSTPGPA